MVKDPKRYLSKLGMQFDVKSVQLDNRLKKLLSADAREEFEHLLEMKSMGMASGTELYAIPTTPKQAAILFSHDAPRYRKTLSWFGEVVQALSPDTVFEVGCGAAFTIGYIQERFPNMKFSGIDEMDNLASIGSELTGTQILSGNYLQMAAADKWDLVVCDFGFDTENLKPSEKPHGTEENDGLKYCPGCSEDLTPQFERYISAWSSWLGNNGCIAVTGRFANFGMLLAFGEAARAQGFSLEVSLSKLLKLKTPGFGTEKFPALVLRQDGQSNLSNSDLAKLYKS